MTTPYGDFGRSGDPEVDRLLEGFGKLSKQYEKMIDELSEANGQGEAADGLVRVEVGPEGSLIGVKIDPRAMRLGSEALADAIMEAATKAQTRATERLSEVMAPLTNQLEGFNHSVQDRLPRMGLTPRIDSDPQIAEALRELQKIRSEYEGR
ncbi:MULTISPECIES: YbaB/EbfC family nucleoid-associated protein [Streptosporangium]|uniref:DNA-binding protein YbaB n=1 Tax=Streptosporangium brasiliense TaxID=47480 RepID=A0ABT9RB00_9ACTN|nr:YbaB/EbfC family nucleoid-associated protein [Streptosporangium brasiliense]MDP9865565.1 DNA-binding protein YbaB [Streptosporangium brasiliense]